MGCKSVYVKFNSVSGGGVGTYDLVDSQGKYIFTNISSATLLNGVTYSVDDIETSYRLQSFSSGSTTPSCNTSTTTTTTTFTQFVSENLRLLFDVGGGLTSSYSGSGTQILDTSYWNSHGTLTNGVGFTTSNTGYLIFDGVDDFITCGTNSNLQFNRDQGFTVCAWIYPPDISVASTQCIASRGNASINYIAWAFHLTNGSFGVSGKGLVLATNGYNTFGGFTNAWVENQWNFVAFTMFGSSSGNGKLYSNGNYLGAIGSALQNPPSDAAIGVQTFFVGKRSQTSGGENHFTRRISAIMAYNRALSADEINSNYNATKSRYGL